MIASLTSTKTNTNILVNLEHMIYAQSVDDGGIPIIGQPKSPPNTQIVFRGGGTVTVKQTQDQINQLIK